ncbi:GerAB/ArcD/ProY family transporter [Paenibacillus sp. NFR01]|uniref:GerAB/ArcD/ProY family transporter n=1 Tax=Paenibacillus sp. NFR01 TaxID=1566279 RepID=UPI0008B4DA0E|nr:GerAB/ArcD/ProY family transporter [Paenibacillus sp. NFR01]SET27639.1 spore germination protein KB [Paenibacillus sp. NFR01]
MIQISRYQMFSLMVVFQLGSTIIFGFASSAGRDAWIATLISMFLGGCIILIYALIYRLTGGLTLVDWWPAYFGKWLGTPIAWLYPLLFLYDAGRIVSDVRFLYPITILHSTPNWLIAVTFLLVILYVLFGGFEVLTRMVGVFFPVIIFSLILEIVLLGFSGRIYLPNMLPLLGDGMGRVWSAVWPLGLMQTYGESIEFAMFWGMLSDKKKLTLPIISACLLSGISITLLDTLAVSAMGEGVFKQMMYPSFALLKLSNIADLLENLDAIGVMYLTLTAFSKLSLHLFAAVFCMRKLLAAQSDKGIIIAACIITFLLSMTMVVSFTGHLQVATTVLPSKIWVPLFIYLPVIVLLLILLKKLAKRSQRV